MEPKQVKDIQTQLKRESKSFEAIQQGAVLALLNTFGFGFEFKRPERIAEKTLQFLIIVEVYFNNKPLEFGKKIDVYCDEQFQNEVDDKMSVNQVKSLKRRRDLNRAALSFNWLIEYVQQFGYMIERRSTKSAKKTLQMEKINKIYKRNGYYFTAAEIHTIGKKMNEYIISQFVKIEKTTKLNEFNPFCLELVRTHDRRCLPQNPTAPFGVEGEQQKEKGENKTTPMETEQNENKENESVKEVEIASEQKQTQAVEKPNEGEKEKEKNLVKPPVPPFNTELKEKTKENETEKNKPPKINVDGKRKRKGKKLSKKNESETLDE